MNTTSGPRPRSPFVSSLPLSFPALTLTLGFLAAATSLLFAAGPSGAQTRALEAPGEPLAYYFPAEELDFDEAVPSPEEFLGYPIGSHHTRHDRIVSYFRELARRSERAVYQEIGYTVELRPMPVLTVTSPGNHGRLDELRQRHLEATDPAADPVPPDERPAVIHLGYGVHGNETSSAEAAMLAAYWLAAGRSGDVERYLGEAIVHVEPVLNPDGRDRHTHWANMHKGHPAVTDPLDREHNEVWPGGRTNHYWFDLNRDWLPLEQPESRARIDFHHRWRPHVVTDYHEMGSGSTYFFEPTEPELSWNDLLPERLYTEVTPTFADYFGEALDAIGSRYFNREDRFDNSYPGYGSTYPNFLGGLGLVFEQASARGLVQSHPTHGVLTFAHGIRNHLRTSLATVRAAVEEKEMLLDYQREFFTSSLEEARAFPVRGWVFGDPHDPTRNRSFLELLLRHRIHVHELAETVERDGRTFRPGSAWVVPMEQPLYRLARSIFERTERYTGRAGSRASAWTMSLAYAIPDAELRGDELPLGGRVTSPPPPPDPSLRPAGFAYLLDWSDYAAPRALRFLLSRGIRAEVATEPFTARTDAGERSYPRGSISVPVGAQAYGPEELHDLVEEAAVRADVAFQTTATSSTSEGIDLGSDAFRPVNEPRLLMIVGEGASNYDSGEIWHLLDTRVQMPVTKVDRNEFGRVPLEEYDVLILVSGAQAALDAEGLEEVRRWIRGGGTLVALRSAAHWAARNGLAPHVEVPGSESGEEGGPEGAGSETGSGGPGEEPDPGAAPLRLDYAEADDRRTRQQILGAMVEVELDPTHPVGYGLHERRMPVWRDHDLTLPPSRNPYSTVARYADEPRLSGFLSPENEERLRGTASVLADAPGRGSVVLFLDNPNYRGFWYGTNRLFLNALFFGDLIRVPPAP